MKYCAIKILLGIPHVKKGFVMPSNYVFAPISSGIMYLNINEQMSRTNVIID